MLKNLHSVLCCIRDYGTVCGVRNFVTFRISSHLVLCRIRYYVAFGIMSHSVLCHIWGYVVWDYGIVRDYVTFDVMSFGIMLHSDLCCILTYVVRDCVLRRNVVQVLLGVISVYRQNGWKM